MEFRRIAPLAVLVLAGGLIFLAVCTKTNNAPILSDITATPSDSALVGTALRLKAAATDADDDPLTYSWAATSGTLAGAAGDSAAWTPTAAGQCTITVVCEDDAGGADTMTRVVRGYQAWRYGSVQGETPDSTFLAPSATTLVPFLLDDEMPEGALLDSAFVTTDLEPDTVGEYFRIWLVTPSGSEVLVYDGLNGEPDVDNFLVQGVKGEGLKGSWRLKVVRNDSPIERYADVCDLDVYYHY
jgi:hypothetical protein